MLFNFVICLVLRTQWYDKGIFSMSILSGGLLFFIIGVLPFIVIERGARIVWIVFPVLTFSNTLSLIAMLLIIIVSEYL